jgi:formylglycine-generating enzyme required for sulfatase activity
VEEKVAEPQPPQKIEPTSKVFTFEVVTVNAKGEKIESRTGQSEYFAEDLGNGIVLEMVSIPSGTFQMGSPATELERFEWEGPQHEVKVPAFWMGRYAITQEQWKAVAKLPKISVELDSDPSTFKGDMHPVETVSWTDAIEFCARVSKKSRKPFRLPSEAEWEYACRAGTTNPFHCGETITPELANYDGNNTYGKAPKGLYREQTTECGSFKIANAFGLFDMHGNVWEWCQDYWHGNYEGAPIIGEAWMDKNDNDNHVVRGGSWYFDPRYCRSSFRYYDTLVNRYYLIGFRVVCDAPRTL